MFHPWTLVYLIAGVFCLRMGIRTLKANPEQWSRRFLACMLFIFAAWPILEFFMNLVDDMALAELLYEMDIFILSFVFFFFLLIPYSMLRNIDRRVLTVFIPPVLVNIVLIIYGGVLTGVEQTEIGVEMHHNEPVFAFWVTVSMIVILTAYVLFYFAYREIEKPEFKRKIKIFCIGCGIAIILGYILDVFGTSLLGLPPLGSVSAAVGMAIASSAFGKS